MEYQKLSKKARGCMLVNECILAFVCTVIIGVIWHFLQDAQIPFNINFIWILAVAIWVLSLAAPFYRYERYRYRFSEEDIDVREGFLFLHRDIVSIERLHKVALESGPVDRIFGLSKVIVTTAGGDVTIRFLEEEAARKIVDRLKVRINQYAVDRRENEGEAGNYQA